MGSVKGTKFKEGDLVVCTNTYWADWAKYPHFPQNGQAYVVEKWRIGFIHGLVGEVPCVSLTSDPGNYFDARAFMKIEV